MKMSKVMMVVMAAMALIMTACGKKATPAQQAIDLIDSTVQKVEQAKDVAELNAIQEEFQKNFDAIENAADYSPTEEEQAQLQTAMQKYLQAYLTRINEMADSSIPFSSIGIDKDSEPANIDEGILEAEEE